MTSPQLQLPELTYAGRRTRRAAWIIFGIACLVGTVSLIVLDQWYQRAMKVYLVREAWRAQRSTAVSDALRRYVGTAASPDEMWVGLRSSFPELQRVTEIQPENASGADGSEGEPADELTVVDPLTGSRYSQRVWPDGGSRSESHESLPLPISLKLLQIAEGGRSGVRNMAPFLCGVLLLGLFRDDWRRRCADLLLGTSIVYALTVATNYATGDRTGWLSAVALLAAGIGLYVAVWRIPEPDTYPRCAHCGYNLTGNVSGICPECGTVIASGRPSDAPRE